MGKLGHAVVLTALAIAGNFILVMIRPNTEHSS